MFARLENRLVDAIRNAKRLIAEASIDRLVPANANPATKVYELVEILLCLLQASEN